jgi:threonyl-tRNA synthetase
MKILLIHSDFIEFEPKKKAIESAEDIEKGKTRIDDCLVVFCSTEKDDKEGVSVNAVKEIKDVAEQVKTKKIVLYPFVHLTTKPGSPSLALVILKEMEQELKKDFKVQRAPFGWYKSFDIKCKGHPLAELSREITSEKKEDVSEAIKKESSLKSEWFIMDNGKLHEIKMSGKKIEGFDFSKHRNLEKFAKYEIAKSRVVDKEPPHIKLMKKLQLVDYESGSDPGHFRYMPNGKLVKGLLEEFVSRKMVDEGAMEVETPIMYDYEHPSLKSYLNRFPARQYSIETPNKRVFLRFSACFGQFLMAHDANISYKNLPLWLYELTRYSFRVEQRGELAGLRRLRAFTMPDCHSLCIDMEQAKKDMLKRFELAKNIVNDIGIKLDNDLEMGLRLVKDFYEENKDFVKELAGKMKKPVLVEMWNKKFFYFVMKYELNFVDCLDKAAALTTDQIDVENAERYGIVYTDKDNKKKHPIILHLSPSGAIERVMYALLEKQHIKKEEAEKAKKKYNQLLPLWLSPTQVRFCPVNDTFNKKCEELANSLEKKNIRTDVDDRTESIGKKVRDAETEWVPMTIVVGEKESSGRYQVRFREDGRTKEMSLDEVVSFVHENTKGMPYKPLALPRLLTKRPVFNG